MRIHSIPSTLVSSFNNFVSNGLPLFKATALKYGFNNPIGDDEGNESNYGDE